jgi:hypothetical protein
MAEICVVHLVWAPLGLGPLERFAASYRRYEAGVDHELLLVFKEFRDRDALAAVEQEVVDLRYETLHMPRRKLDLAAYAAIARDVDARAFCFLNSSSELLDSGWLAKLLGQLDAPRVGLVGATGSYESLVPPAGGLRLLRRPWFAPYPNPHVRTNAFMIEREVALSLDWPEVRTKWGAWRVENGKRSLTRQVWANGLDALVVGRDGEAYERDRWYESHTFRSGGQANLLVADNRTRQFAEADPSKQARLAELAWGRVS